LADMTPQVAREAGILRGNYQEKLPWGDCTIAASAILQGADCLVTEDPHFKGIM
jgi:predicted nucleic acid-binding protein